MSVQIPKMIPGQIPYTVEEAHKLYELVHSAAEAIEMFSEDELERYAEHKDNQSPWI